MRSISINDSDFDIAIDANRNLAMVTEKACVTQDATLASLMLLGENPWNTEQGVPYMETVFQRKRPFEFEQALREEIERVPNVRRVSSITLLQLEGVLQYEATIETTYGPANI